MSNWTIENSKRLYGVDTWGSSYFNINDKGHLVATPQGPGSPHLNIYQVVQELYQRGIATPLLIRMADLTKRRVELLNECFRNAIQDMNYKGSYRSVYPIKVNQQRHLIEELVRFGDQVGMGLECGSKPELMVVLAMMRNPEGLIICNGFKDSEYIEMALLANKLGKHVITVVDRKDELPMIIAAAKKFNTKPHIGFRVKLHTRTSGKWEESTGDRSKFGLTTLEIVEGFRLLEKEGMLDSLELLHFHTGSQIPSIGHIKSSLKEGARFYTELRKMGADIRYLDVGGGLGVDYDGSGESDSSINYTEQEYANDVVSIIQSTCEEAHVQEPTIITENGRALVAHHSILVFDVLGANLRETAEPVIPRQGHRLIDELKEILQNLSMKNFTEYYHDVTHIKANALQLFTYGIIDLEQMAAIDSFYWSILTKMSKMIEGNKDYEDIQTELHNLLSDIYYCNFSVFQSLPDSWAVGQVFPVMPIHRLDEKPTRHAVLVDLTCDSDGILKHFVDPETGQPKKTINMHGLTEGEAYYIGVFLVGAYQETLGDLHNLFGDTNAIHVSVGQDGEYFVDDVVEGDTVSEVLSYVQYNRDELVRSLRLACEKGISNNSMTRQEAALFMKYYEQGLAGYTYLEEPDDMTIPL